MGRHIRPYSIQKRPTTRKNRSIFYVKFRDPETGAYGTALSSGCTRRDDAVRWAEQRLSSGVGQRSGVRFRDYAAGFWDRDGRYAQGRIVRGKSISSGTLEIAEANTKNHLIPRWGNLKLSAMNAGQIDLWVIKLHKTASLQSATINKLLQTLRIILAQAVKDGLIRNNPARDVEPLKDRPQPRGVFTVEELMKLFSQGGVWPDDTHFAINLLAASTGMRMGEIRGLGVGSVTDRRVEIIRSWEQGHGFKEPKCGSCRVLPLWEGVSEVLSRVASRKAPEDILFYGKRGKSVPISKSVVEKYFREALGKIGIADEQRVARGLCFHSYRHSVITILRATGASDSKVHYIAGHRPTGIQDRYTHYGPDDMDVLVDFQKHLLPAERPRLTLLHSHDSEGTPGPACVPSAENVLS